jgi:hypothetical protein
MTRLEELEQKLRFMQKEIEFLKKKEKPIKPEYNDLSNCCCDYTNHCPVHGSTPIYDYDSYIAQP